MTSRLLTLQDLVVERAIRDPDGIAYVFLSGEAVQTSWTYKDLRLEVAKVAARLDEAGASGRRAMLVYPQGVEFLAAFLACVSRDVLAVPVPAPETWNLLRTMPRIRSVAEDADASLVLATRKVLKLASQRADLWDFEKTPWVATDGLDGDEADLGDSSIDPQATAYLQYTSGSTSAPSGVEITHANIMHHLGALHEACAYGDGPTVTWMPHFHDYGLVQGLLQPLYSGVPCYFMSPLSFLRKPAHWLGAISKYRATHSQAPNFAYDHCVRRVTDAERAELDLSSWKAAGNAAEPINPEVLEAFIRAFEPAGFRRSAAAPAYGLAEATLLVSSTRPNGGPRILDLDARALSEGRIAAPQPGGAVRRVVGCGEVVGGTKVAIVDPERLMRSGPDEIGEIWVSDPAVAAGYWKQQAKSQATFGARLADTGEGPFLRTGDLGFLRDGQLYISGRHKDMIIVRGANFAPQDIEWTSQRSHPSVESGECVAFPLLIDGEERLGLVQELGRRVHPSDVDFSEVATKIRESISLEYEVRPYVIALARHGAILKTSSGKLQRRASRDALVRGDLETLYRLQDGPLPSV